ncbi:MAG TPA: DinB family protein [bacterium]|nr:DinB family protein [bacterium]
MNTTFPPEVLGHLIVRELGAVRKELLAYEDERDIWLTPAGVSNSAGTLTLHVVGNLRHFLGSVLGGSGYVRRRNAEFSARDVPLHELLEEIGAAQRDVRQSLGQVPPDALQARYPAPLGGLLVNTEEFLLHLLSHLAYHLGQIDYHRRVVTGNTGGVGAVDIAELGTATPAT